MHKNGGVVNFNDDQLKIIKENVDTIYHKILNTRFKQVLISNAYKIIAYLIFILGFLVITIGIVLIYSVLRVNLSKRFYLFIIIIGIILILFGSLLIIMRQVYAQKIKQAILYHATNYLKMAVNATFKAVEISRVSNEFTIMPQKFLVMGSAFNHRVTTEKVIIGSINDKNFNCGTMLEKITRTWSTGKTEITTTTYNRYLYFTCLINVQEVTTTIVPETLKTRIMGSNRGDQLESPKFEKLFALDYSDPIKLRKLLVPKVMSNMIDLANEQVKIPNIYVNTNQVTLMFPYMNIVSVDSNVANLLNLIIGDSEEKLLANIIEMLNFTLETLLKSYEWIVSLDLAKELLFK